MDQMTIIWVILGFISIIVLIYTFSVGITIIWRACIIGIIIGLAIAFKYNYDGLAFDWLLLVKGGIIGSIVGTVFSFFVRR